MGRGKAVGEDVMRERRKRQEIGSKKRQKKLYETVYTHQVLRAPNQLICFTDSFANLEPLTNLSFLLTKNQKNYLIILNQQLRKTKL